MTGPTLNVQPLDTSTSFRTQVYHALKQAITEMDIGHFDAARRVLAKAEQAYATIQRMVLNLDDPHHQNEILTRLGELRATIDAAHQWLGFREGTPEP